MKHLAAVAVAAATVTASAIAGAAPTAAAWHMPDPPVAAPALAVQRLTDAQLAGQRVIYSYPGLTPPRSLLRAIRRGEAAGVIFFAGNISSPAQLAAVSRRLQRADASWRNPVRAPLLLMADQEGGIVRRLPGPPDLSEKQIGQAADPPAQAAGAGTGAAVTLRQAGLNVNLAPVLDVYRAGNFIDQYGRSYSRHAGPVARLGAEFVRAQQSGGVAAAAKHFPGLGAASRDQDTDLRPVRLRVRAATLRQLDERPYRAAIAAGVRLIMVSWAVYPALDPNRPAGLSPVVVQGELRQRLGFQGVTITDALEAGALRGYGTIARRGQLAALAGMDLLLCAGHSTGEGQRAAAGLTRAYRDGLLSRAAGQAAVARIAALRSSLR